MVNFLYVHFASLSQSATISIQCQGPRDTFLLARHADLDDPSAARGQRMRMYNCSTASQPSCTPQRARCRSNSRRVMNPFPFTSIVANSFLTFRSSSSTLILGDGIILEDDLDVFWMIPSLLEDRLDTEIFP
jgi:hypothetical protein